MTDPDASPYRMTLQDLEAQARVEDEDRVEEQDAVSSPAQYPGGGDVPGHPGVSNRT